MMLATINGPRGLRCAILLPGGVVRVKVVGSHFVPLQFLEKLVTNADYIILRDNFRHMRGREQK